MPKATVTTTRSGLQPGELNDIANKAVRESLSEAAGRGAEVSRALASQRRGDPAKRKKQYQALPHMSDIVVSRVFGTENGWAVIVKSPVFWGRFQDKGTQRGIVGLNFIQAGLRVARQEFLPELKRRLPG